MAHILYLEWNSYAGKFITKAWKKNNDTFVSFWIDTKEDTRLGEEITKALVLKMMSEKFDYVFSFNYFPVAAMAAKACRLPYISFVYDNPYAQLYSKTASLDTNKIFIFDSQEVRRLNSLGINTVKYLPLASDTDFYDALPILTPKQVSRYSSDISFVGSLYIEEKQRLYQRFEKLDSYTKGYLDGLVTAQKKLYGVNLLEDAMTKELVDKMQEISPLMEHPDSFATKEWTYANYYLYREVTAQERSEILNALADYDIKIYTSEEAGAKLKAGAYKDFTSKICPKVDYYKEAPYVYQNSKINLNITLKSIGTGIPLRIFDIMANRGFVITNYQEDLFEIFEPGEDFVYYTDINDLIEKIDYYLEHDEERESIAGNAYEKIKAHHNFYDRLGSFTR